jgi:flagellar protein FliL
MPPTRTETTADPAEIAASVPASHQAPSAGGVKAWLPLGVTVLVMPVLAYCMTTMVIVPRIQKSLAETSVAATDPAAKAVTAPTIKKESVTMNKLLVNVAGTMGGRYLLVSLSVAGMDPNFKARVQEVEPQLRDAACGTLAAKTLADLEKPGARNLIRAELVSSFNNILGSPLVQEIYLTEFAIQ